MIKFALIAGYCLSLTAGTIVYSDFGPGQTYNTSSGHETNNVVTAIAEGFTPSTSGSLSEVDLALAYFNTTPPSNDLSVALETDSSGIPSGTVLDSWSLSHSTITSTATIYPFVSTLHPALSSSNVYWVVIQDNEANGYVWLLNTQGVTGEDYNNGSWNIGSGGNYPSNAFDVQTGSGSGVPEPNYYGLTALATLMVIGVSRRRRRPAPSRG
jgi:hypothetical protein